MTEWRAVPGYEGLYEASDAGHIRSLDRTVNTAHGSRRLTGRTIRSQLNQGYPSVRLCRDGSYWQTAVHRIIAAAFIGPRLQGLVVNHKNGVKTDNRLANLEYVTAQENGWHAWRSGLCDSVRGENHYRSVLTEAMILDAGRRNANGESIASVAQGYGVKANTLSQALVGSWAHLRGRLERIRSEEVGRPEAA